MAAGGWVVLVTEPVDGTGHAIDVTGGSWLHRSKFRIPDFGKGAEW